MEAVRSINAFAIGHSFPDRTLVLVSDEGSARARIRDEGQGDRIGARSEDYHRSVIAAFHAIAEAEPRRVRLVDGSGSADEVTQRLLGQLADLL